MDFSSRLKKLRKESGYTQQELAKKVGVKRATIAGYETKGKEPNYTTLKELAAIFDCSTDYLLGRVAKKNPQAKLRQLIPTKTLELLDEEDIQFLIELSQDEQRQVLLRESRNLTNQDLVKIIKIIKTFAETEDN